MLSSIGCLSKVILCPLIWFAEEREEYEEQVDDINVDLQGAVDVFLGVQLVFPPAHHHLRVIHQELKNSDKILYTVVLMSTRESSIMTFGCIAPICENSYHVLIRHHWEPLNRFEISYFLLLSNGNFNPIN